MKKHIVLNTLLFGFVFVFATNILMAQSNEELAKEQFSDGEFAQALPHFESLYKLYPTDAWVQYYYGVCLTETNRFSLETRKILLQSAQDNVPGNVFFYIAKNYHAMEQFETARQYYERFDDYARKREKRKLNFDTYYEACINNENPFDIAQIRHEEPTTENEQTPTQAQVEEAQDATTPKPAKTEENETVTSTEPENTQQVEFEAEPIEKETLEIPAGLSDSIFNFNVIGDILYHQLSQFKTTEGKTSFMKGIINSRQLDQSMNKVNLLRKQYQNAGSEEQKKEIAQKVIDLELENIKLKSVRDQAYSEARRHEMSYWNHAQNDEKIQLKNENDSIVASLRTKNEPIQTEETISAENNEELTPDTLAVENEQTATAATEENIPEETAPAAVAPPAESENDIRYKVQIGAYSKGLPEYIDRLYKKLSVLRKIDNYTDDRGIVVYTIGNVDNFEDAVKLQNQIRQEGVKDAFVVAYNNRKRITLSEAREIQKNETSKIRTRTTTENN